jgi:signal transduction histidine kinase
MISAPILNVDDFDPGRYMRSEALRQAGFTVTEARSGREALEKMSMRPALVLLDVNLPDISGLEVCRRIRANPETAGTIVVHVSASRREPRDCITGLDNGADLYLNEPIDADFLAATLKALIRAHSAESALRQSNQALRSLTHMLTHELRQSVRGVLLPAELLERRLGGQLGAEDAGILGQILPNARRIHHLVEGILSYSQAEREESQVSDISAAAALRASMEELDLLITESQATVEVGELPNVRGNAVSLARVFCNLIVNSIKYRSAKPPHIRIDAVSQGEFYQFAVRDNGVGIAPEYHARIFDPFKRLHGAAFEGIGIGLALCKRLIESSGGEIWVESEVGRGATFYFTLPAAKNQSTGDEETKPAGAMLSC